MIAAGLIALAMTAWGSTGYSAGGADPSTETQAVAERRIRAAHLISLRAVARVRMARFRTGAELVRCGLGRTNDPGEAERPLHWQMEDHVNREEPVGELVGRIRENALLAEADSRNLEDLVRRHVPPHRGRMAPPVAGLKAIPCRVEALADLVECAESCALTALRAAQLAELDADRAIGLGGGVLARTP